MNAGSNRLQMVAAAMTGLCGGRLRLIMGLGVLWPRTGSQRIAEELYPFAHLLSLGFLADVRRVNHPPIAAGTMGPLVGLRQVGFVGSLV